MARLNRDRRRTAVRLSHLDQLHPRRSWKLVGGPGHDTEQFGAQPVRVRGSSSTTPTPSSTPSSSTKSSSSPSVGTKSYTGDVAQTRWGPVEVEVTVADGTITKVTVVQSPRGNGRDIEINNRALPVLVQETVDAQSAQIDMVSGATVTSDGYVQSLQSALDAAGI